MTTIYTTRTEAIEREIITAIEAGGTDVARAEEYDIDAIANEVIVPTNGAYIVIDDVEAFWTAVERHAK